MLALPLPHVYDNYNLARRRLCCITTANYVTQIQFKALKTYPVDTESKH
jgi:hypothetical protein